MTASARPSTDATDNDQVGQRYGRTITGTRGLVRFMLRRDRVRLPAWVAGLGAFVVYVAFAVPQIAPSQADLDATATLFDSPAARMWVGPGYGMDAVTYERFFASGYTLYLFILGALMNILLVARHTRADEESGRAEMVRANVVGRHAPLTAALAVAAITNLLATIVVFALVAVNYSMTGSLIVGVTLGVTGFAFAAITAVTVQLSESARVAAGLAGGVLGIAFMTRGLGDMAAVGGSALSWASPLGWASQTAPFVHDRWWPLAFYVALGVTMTIAAYGLHAHRDFAAGIVTVRGGRSRTRTTIGTPLGLAWRLRRGEFLGWGALIVVFALADGAFAQTMVDAARDMPEMLLELFGGVEGVSDGYRAFLAEYSGYLTVAYTAFAARSLLIEENRGRAELILATPTRRFAWAGAHFVVIAVNAGLIMVTSGVMAGVAVGAVTGDWSAVGVVAAAHLNLLPAVFAVLGVIALFYGWAPRLMAPVGWALAGLTFFVGTFAQLLHFPAWALNLSPMQHSAKIPIDDFTPWPVLVMTGLALVLGVAGLIGLERRQIVNKG